eukprot:gene5696-4061_t
MTSTPLFKEFPVHHSTAEGILVQLPHNAGFGRLTLETLGGDALAATLLKSFAARSLVPAIATRRRDRQGYRLLTVDITEGWSELRLGTTTTGRLVRSTPKGTVFEVQQLLALAVLEQLPEGGGEESDGKEVEVRLLNYDVSANVLHVTANPQVVDSTPLDTHVAAQALASLHPGDRVRARVLLSSTDDHCAVVEVPTGTCSLLGYYLYDSIKDAGSTSSSSAATALPAVGSELELTVEFVADCRSLQDVVPFLVLSHRKDFATVPEVRGPLHTVSLGLVGPLSWRDSHSSAHEAGHGHSCGCGHHVAGETASDEEDAGDEDADGVARLRRRRVEEAVDAYERQMFDAAPSNAEEFQRLLLASPNSSYLWTQFMAHYVKLQKLEEARQTAERALQTISPRLDEELLNVWVAYMNLENLYGTGESLNAVFKRALPRQVDPLVLHERLADIFEASRKSNQLLTLCRTMTSKWPRVPRTWERLGRVLAAQNKRDQLKRMLKDMGENLKKNEAAAVVVRLAVREYKQGSVEAGRALLEGLLAKIPKKSDVWLAFVDQEVALLARKAPQASLTSVRSVLDRAVAMNFTAKVTQLLFTRYMNFEKVYGTAKDVEKVKQMARNYVDAKIQAAAQPGALPIYSHHTRYERKSTQCAALQESCVRFLLSIFFLFHFVFGFPLSSLSLPLLPFVFRVQCCCQCATEEHSAVVVTVVAYKLFVFFFSPFISPLTFRTPNGREKFGCGFTTTTCCALSPCGCGAEGLCQLLYLTSHIIIIITSKKKLKKIAVQEAPSQDAQEAAVPRVDLLLYNIVIIFNLLSLSCCLRYPPFSPFNVFTMATEHFDSVKIMIENLRSENAELRLSSMQGIHYIASTLGPQRTREELLLYLTDYLDDNDELLRVFASALGTMLEEVGGVAYTQSLLGPLEMLCSLEEITVRDEAVKSLKVIGSKIFSGTGPNEVRAQKDFESVVQRLSKAAPQCRSSACALISCVYTATTSAATKEHLRHLFARLVADDEILVRRAACIALGESFAKALSAADLPSVIPYLKSFAKDQSDGIRLRAVTTCSAVLAIIGKSQRSAVLTLVTDLAGDTSWRVRYMMADTLGKLSGALSSSPDVERYVVPVFRNLCQDKEPEVRASAVYNMASVLAACSDTAGKREVLVTGTRLLSDTVGHVRVSLANAVLRSVAHVPKDLWGPTILPACTALLRDEESDVRLALVSGFSSMGSTREAKELAPKLIPVIIELASDTQWRLREVVLQQVPYIITSLESSASDVLNVCVERLVDRVATIREAAVQSCCKLVAEKGVAWSTQVLFPRVLPIAKDKNYLHRVSLCHLFASLAHVAAMDSGATSKTIWPVILQLRSDPVPNVRLNVAKAVLALLKAGKVTAKDADTVLSKLRQDNTVDVRDAATVKERRTEIQTEKKQANSNNKKRSPLPHTTSNLFLKCGPGPSRGEGGAGGVRERAEQVEREKTGECHTNQTNQWKLIKETKNQTNNNEK